jgi:hypothetical protein
MTFAPLEGWRRVEVADHHAAADYAKNPRSYNRNRPRQTQTALRSI